MKTSKELRAALTALQVRGEGSSAAARDLSYEIVRAQSAELEAAQNVPLAHLDAGGLVAPLAVCLAASADADMVRSRLAAVKRTIASTPNPMSWVGQEELGALERRLAQLEAVGPAADEFAAQRAQARATLASLEKRNPVAASAYADRYSGLIYGDGPPKSAA